MKKISLLIMMVIIATIMSVPVFATHNDNVSEWQKTTTAIVTAQYDFHYGRIIQVVSWSNDGGKTIKKYSLHLFGFTADEEMLAQRVLKFKRDDQNNTIWKSPEISKKKLMRFGELLKEE